MGGGGGVRKWERMGGVIIFISLSVLGSREEVNRTEPYFLETDKYTGDRGKRERGRDRQTARGRDRQSQRGRERKRARGRDRLTHREEERQKDTERGGHRQTRREQTDRQTDRDSERQREKLNGRVLMQVKLVYEAVSTAEEVLR